MMDLVIVIAVGLAFTAFAALVFAVLTIGLDRIGVEAFAISGPDDWAFGELYVRYLIIAATFTFVSLPLNNGIAGMAALAVAYKYVFDAGWEQALIMGIAGGIIALVLFLVLMSVVLAPFLA